VTVNRPHWVVDVVAGEFVCVYTLNSTHKMISNRYFAVEDNHEYFMIFCKGGNLYLTRYRGRCRLFRVGRERSGFMLWQTSSRIIITTATEEHHEERRFAAAASTPFIYIFFCIFDIILKKEPFPKPSGSDNKILEHP
jgi:hypothetical protein